MISDRAVDELLSLREQHMLTPCDVLEHARNPESALHPHFEWNDSKAAHAHRLEQAQHLIVRAKVRILARPDDAPRHIRAVVQPVQPIAPAHAAIPMGRPNPPDSPTPEVSPAPSSPRWAPLIVPPSKAPTGPDEEDDDIDDDGHREVSRVMRIEHRSDKHVHVDEKAGAVLLRIALSELVAIRRRYAHLAALTPVFAALDQLAHAAVEPESSRLTAAAHLARSLMDREGLDLQTAASRASEVHEVDRWEVLEALRSRSAG
jgi:hypothetical protein